MIEKLKKGVPLQKQLQDRVFNEGAYKQLLKASMKRREFICVDRPSSAGGDSGPNPGPKKSEEDADADRVMICEGLWKLTRRISPAESQRSLAERQWRDILTLAIEGSLSQLKKGEELAIGLANQQNIKLHELAGMAINAIFQLRAQGDLSFPDIPDLEEFYASGQFTQFLPFSNVQSIDIFESKIYLFSDSVLKMGNTVNKWPQQYETHINYAGVKKFTTHGQPFQWLWDVVPNTRTVTILSKIKEIVDTQYKGEPRNLTGRIIIFGCLNDIVRWPKNREEPLIKKYVKIAEETRDYLAQFRAGRIIWLGPGTDRVWNYDERGYIWEPWADKFMNIIAQSGIPIFRGGVALLKRQLRKEGKTSASRTLLEIFKC